MIDLFKREYWSKSYAFLLPLTGMPKTLEFEVTTYLQWNEYSIDNYNLIVKVVYGQRYDAFQDYFNKVINENKDAFVVESYDFEGFTILIYDISMWKADIGIFLKGKYSKFSKRAKDKIEIFHIFYKDKKKKINFRIYSCLNPMVKQVLLDNLTAIEYAARHYDMEYEVMEKIGEICSKCELERETLILDASHVVIPVRMD